MRKLATVDIITDIKPIENADNLELAFVRGWQAVVKKGKFKKGDKVIYCEIDSVLPELPEYEFLRKSCYVDNGECKGFRIKTLLLRGVLSQGLILPVGNYGNLEVGKDVTEELGIVKYELPIRYKLAGDIKGEFPCIIPKTDEARIQNIPEEELLKINIGDNVWVTEKIDGASMTIYANVLFNPPNKKAKIDYFGICGKEFELKPTSNNAYWKAVNTLNLKEKLQSFLDDLCEQDNDTFSFIPFVAVVQGELIGERVQKNRYKIKGFDFYVFSLYLWQKVYSDKDKSASYLKDLEKYGFKLAPRIEVTSPLFSHSDYLKFAEGKSLINPTVEREGIVVRDAPHHTSFKVISNKYLLK